MKRARILLPSLICAAWALAISPVHAAPVKNFGAIDGQSADPLAGSYSFFLFPASSRTAQLIFESDEFSGVVRLDIKCCEVDVGGVWVGGGWTETLPGGIAVEALGGVSQSGNQRLPAPPPRCLPGTPCPASLPANSFMIAKGAGKIVGLRITTSATPTFGRFRAAIFPYGQLPDKPDAWSGFQYAQVIFSVLPPIPQDAAAPNCPTQLDGRTARSWIANIVGPGGNVIPARSLAKTTQDLYDQKRSNPAKTMWSIGDDIAEENGLRYDIAPSSMPLRPDQVELVFSNNTQWDKMFEVFDGNACAPAFAPTALSSGQSSQPVIFSSTPGGQHVQNNLPMTTLLFRRRVCKAATFGNCVDSGGWDNIAVLSAPPFWRFFGGHRVTVSWVASQGEMP